MNDAFVRTKAQAELAAAKSVGILVSFRHRDPSNLPPGSFSGISGFSGWPGAYSASGLSGASGVSGFSGLSGGGYGDNSQSGGGGGGEGAVATADGHDGQNCFLSNGGTGGTGSGGGHGGRGGRTPTESWVIRPRRANPLRSWLRERTLSFRYRPGARREARRTTT